MSYVLATPEMVAAAANNLAQIGSTLSAANAAALAPTTGVLAAGADEVSAAVARWSVTPESRGWAEHRRSSTRCTPSAWTRPTRGGASAVGCCANCWTLPGVVWSTWRSAPIMTPLLRCIAAWDSSGSACAGDITGSAAPTRTRCVGIRGTRHDDSLGHRNLLR